MVQWGVGLESKEFWIHGRGCEVIAPGFPVSKLRISTFLLLVFVILSALAAANLYMAGFI
jgi:hypothetical protein